MTATTAPDASRLDLTLPAYTANPIARLRWGLRDALTVAGRSLRQIRRVPERLGDVTIQPVIFVLLFAEVFGTAIKLAGGGSYHEYLLPGIAVQSALFGCVGPAVSTATDLHEGFVDRLRSLPIARASIVGGRLLAELATAVFGLVVTLVVGVIVGWRVHRGVGHTLLGLLLLALFLLAATLLGTLIGMLVRSSDAVPGVLFPILFPITFLANTFVPLQGLPGWLRAVAEWNPVSAFVAATRGQFGNPQQDVTAWPLRHALPLSFGYAVALVVVLGGLTLLRWRRVAAG